MNAYSAIVPCHNESENIPEAYASIVRELELLGTFEIIFIDDGSTDNSLQLMKRIAASDDRVKYIAFTGHFGLEAACRAGYRYAQYEWCIQLDADLQSPPEDVAKLVEAAGILYDAVFALRSNRADPWLRVAASNVQHWIARYVFQIEMPYRASVFRLVRTRLARAASMYPSRSSYFIATIPRLTERYCSATTSHRARIRGRSSWSAWKLASHCWDLCIGFSPVLPLLLTIVGIVVTLQWLVAVYFWNATALQRVFDGLLWCYIAIVIGVIADYIRRPVIAGGPEGFFMISEMNIKSDPTESELPSRVWSDTRAP